MNPAVLGISAVVLISLGVATFRAPRLTSVIFWALAATIFVCSALFMHAPGPFSEKGLWITLAVPIVWVGLQFWSYWDRKAWRPAVGLCLLTIASGVIVFLSEPLV